MSLGRSLAGWTMGLAPTPLAALWRAGLGLLLPQLSAAARADFLEQVAADCEALRARGESERALALVAAVDVSVMPSAERADAALAVGRLAHRLRLSRAREEDLGPRLADFLVDLLAERLEEASARAMPSRQVAPHQDALNEVLALNLLREPFEGLAGKPVSAVFREALDAVEGAQRLTRGWRSLPTVRLLKEVESQVRELRDAVEGRPEPAGQGLREARS